MVRAFFRIAIVHPIVAKNLTEGAQGTVLAGIIHSVRTENTFFTETSFRQAMGVSFLDDLRAQNPGVGHYKHRITSNAVSIGVYQEVSMVIEAVDHAVLSPRFGEFTRIKQPADAQVSLIFLQSTLPGVTFTLDGAAYKIREDSIRIVGGRKYG